LEVWEGVHSEEIGLINNGRVGAVSPDIPGINVSDCHLGQRSAGESLSNLLNVADDLCWSSSNSGWVVLETSWRDTVKILRSNRDAVDTACELLAVLLDGRCKGSNLVVDDCLTCRSPETKEKLSVCRDGGWDGRDRGVVCAGLDHGVESGTRESTICVGKTLGSVEFGGKGSFILHCSLSGDSSIVESSSDGGSDREGCRKGNEGGVHD